MALVPFRLRLRRRFPIADILLLGLLALFAYALMGVAQDWTGPYRPRTEISLTYGALVKYSFFSLVRVTLAYFLSLAFTFAYGYAAAKTRWGERVLIPILDILQSVPVLGFMPGLVLALVALFPHSNFGLELAAIVMIFTGEGWNMVFSFYSSLKSVPQEWRELGKTMRLNNVETLRRIEIPHATNGLLWNSMLSMAGGWFFLMTIESFSLGDKDFRLPGIGAYMAVAYEQNDIQAIIAGIIAMFSLIILVDRVVWAPLVVWSERFRSERERRAGEAQRSLVLEWIKHSDLLPKVISFIRKTYRNYFPKKKKSKRKKNDPLTRLLTMAKSSSTIVTVTTSFMVGLTLVLGSRGIYKLMTGISWLTWLWLLKETFYTLIRVAFSVAIGSLWAIPVGVFIGTNPKWTRRLQPVVQVVASFPAPMLFPILLFVLLNIGVSLQAGAVVLLLFASQWYILFNVISGATRIPKALFEVGEVFQLKGQAYWKTIIIPAIFPSLVNGWITAAGAAWNATIVSEFVIYKGQTYSASGIGAAISGAAQAGDYPLLTASVIVMVTVVVLINQFFWNNLYKLAETRFKID